MCDLKEKLAGKFIVLDGPDGCGKSTQVRMLCEWLNSRGIEAVAFRDPGTTQIGEKIRSILLNPDHAVMDTQTELLLYMAARAQLWAEKIQPTLKSGKWVILDRWLSSTCAYQGYAGRFGIENVIKLAKACLERLWPELTIILDVDLATAGERMGGEPDRMEQKGADYHQKVREGFLQLKYYNKAVTVIDASQSIEQVHRKVTEVVGKIE